MGSDNINKNKVHKFLNTHPNKEFSEAKIEYSLYLEPKAEEYVNKIAEKILAKSEKDLEYEKLIEHIIVPEELLILSILVYTFFPRMFDLMLPLVMKHSIVPV